MERFQTEKSIRIETAVGVLEEFAQILKLGVTNMFVKIKCDISETLVFGQVNIPNSLALDSPKALTYLVKREPILFSEPDSLTRLTTVSLP